MKPFIDPIDIEWLEHKLLREDAMIDYPPQPSELLKISHQIGQAYEQEKPVIVVYQSEQGYQQFCGFIEQLDPHDRWLSLVNGSLRKEIALESILFLKIA